MRIFGLEIKRTKALNAISDWRLWLRDRRASFWIFAKPILLHPLSYVLFLGFSGAAMIVAGVALYFGMAAAFVSSGAFMILGARYICKGMTNG